MSWERRLEVGGSSLGLGRGRCWRTKARLLCHPVLCLSNLGSWTWGYVNIDSFSSDYINISEFLLWTFSRKNMKIIVHVHLHTDTSSYDHHAYFWSTLGSHTLLIARLPLPRSPPPLKLGGVWAPGQPVWYVRLSSVSPSDFTSSHRTSLGLTQSEAECRHP